MSTNNLSQVTIYTDGGCSPNPGLGGWAAIITTVRNGQTIEREIKGAVEHANNQRMELTAVAEALESLKQPCEVELFADSQYVVKGMMEWVENWKQFNWHTTKHKPVKHADLWKRIVAQTERHVVTFKWVKAHDGETLNERVDALVRQARDEFNQAPEQPETEDRYRLLIAGSRSANDAMLEYTRRVVARAIENAWEIVVGDNPDGIDAAVVQECNRLKYTHVIVVGIADEPRNGGVENARYIRIGASYTERDQMMAKSSQRGLYIWDGKSAGTRNGYEYLKSLGKTAHLMNFAQTFA
jgi:ribonuclease HI